MWQARVTRAWCGPGGFIQVGMRGCEPGRGIRAPPFLSLGREGGRSPLESGGSFGFGRKRNSVAIQAPSLGRERRPWPGLGGVRPECVAPGSALADCFSPGGVWSGVIEPRCIGGMIMTSWLLLGGGEEGKWLALFLSPTSPPPEWDITTDIVSEAHKHVCARGRP